MTKLARERAEKRRDEEKSRMLEQKERAAQRLRELDEKMAAKKKESAGTKIGTESRNPGSSDVGESSNRSRAMLVELQQKE